jgi:uncharacterized protein YdeI (YjbR/CyaY-like superfamily)
METYQDLPVLFFKDDREFEEWIKQHHSDQTGVWLKFAKKASGVASLNYAGALDVALCWGWIDGQAKTIDETYYLQRFTPRRKKSLWSKRNVGKVAELIKAGRMQPSGQAEIDRAKADGRWDAAYDGPANTVMPEEFQKALDANPKAKEFYASLNKTNTYAFLWRINTAVKPETRTRRIEKFIGMLERGETFH